MLFDHAVLAIHSDPGEIAHMLVGTGQLIEQCCFAAVLISHQRKGQGGAGGKWIAASLGVVFAAFTESGMDGRSAAFFLFDGEAFRLSGNRFNGDPVCIIKPQSELIAVYLQLHGIPHGGVFHDSDFGTGNHSHVQKVLPEGSFSAHRLYDTGTSDFQVFDGHSKAAFYQRICFMIHVSYYHIFRESVKEIDIYSLAGV